VKFHEIFNINIHAVFTFVKSKNAIFINFRLAEQEY